MKTHKMDQRSDDWFEIRKGKLTASNAQAISANGKGLETYVYQLLAEKYSNNKEHYTNADIERGIELEDQARLTYEVEYEKVTEVGFIEMDEEVGCSPDGLVGKDGMLEIKCMNDPNHFRFILDKKIKPEWLWQMQMQLLVTGRKWVDFVAYNPNFKKSLIVVRVKPDLVMREKLVLGIGKGVELINQINKNYEQTN